MATHKERVEFERELYRLKAGDLDGFVGGGSDGGPWWASGLCPVCRGDAWGPDRRLAPTVETKTAGFREDDDEYEEVADGLFGDVLVDCRCGNDHGKAGMVSCGRRFVVRVQVIAEAKNATATQRFKYSLTAAPLPSERDVDAIRAINTYRAEQLPRARARAEKWIAGLTAVVGVLATAVVLKGPDDFSKLPEINQWIAVILMLAGGAALVFGVWKAYEAAYGSPLPGTNLAKLVGKKPSSSNSSIVGAADRWDEAVKGDLKSSKKSLSRAAQSTAVGVGLLAAAIAVAWLSFPAKTPAAGTCVKVDDATLRASSIAEIVDGSLELEVVQCP